MGSRRRAVIALAGLLVGGAITINLGSAATVPSELVEGHTVFVAISNFTGLEDHEGPAAAVAVLVREHNIPLLGRMPGVLWYNDQYLVNPSAVQSDARTRYPCTGAVIAVERGHADPREGVRLSPNARYVESYHITDPNDVGWDIDKWNLSTVPYSTSYAWTVAIGNARSSSDIPDDGVSSCDPVRDRGCPLPIDETGCYHNDVQNVDPSIDRLDCLPPNCGTLRYNALLFFWLKDIENSGTPKDHSGGNSSGDASGCHENDPEFGCPEGDDDAEGNSHRVFNPLAPTIEHGSAKCGGNETRPTDPGCHRTAGIDVYYGTAPTPLDRNYVLYDGEGATEALTCGGLPEWLGTCLP